MLPPRCAASLFALVVASRMKATSIRRSVCSRKYRWQANRSCLACACYRIAPPRRTCAPNIARISLRAAAAPRGDLRHASLSRSLFTTCTAHAPAVYATHIFAGAQSAPICPLHLQNTINGAGVEMIWALVLRGAPARHRRFSQYQTSETFAAVAHRYHDRCFWTTGGNLG